MDNNTEKIELKPLFRLIAILWQYKGFLVIFNLVIAVTTIVTTLLMPKWYTAKTTIIIKQSEEVDTDFSGQISNLSMLGMGISTDQRIKRYIALLKSENISDSIIIKFNLKEVYKQKYRENIYKALAKNTSFVDNEDGTISIYCTYKNDPIKAAEMANEYTRLLINLDKNLNRKKSTEYRQYIENSYNNIIVQMKQNEQKLLEFQRNNVVVDFPKQAEILVEQIAELETQKIKNEIEIRYLRQNFPDNSPTIQDLIIRNREISRLIDELKSSDKYSNIPLNVVPDIYIENMRLVRDITIQNKLQEFLVVQLERARLQENKNFSNVMVLDKGIIPERKSKPQRASIVFITTFFSILFSLFLVTLIDFTKRNRYIIRSIIQ